MRKLQKHSPILIKDDFKVYYGSEASFMVRSPGRINLIGEHVDYNGGVVLPAAIDRYIDFAIAKRTDDAFRFYAADLREIHTGSLSTMIKPEKAWTHYLLGVLDELKKSGRSVGGFDLAFGGNIPAGAGLSSSAALECGFLFCLNRIFNLEMETLEMVQIAQRAENCYVGMKCGIMDQFASMFGKQGQVIRLDCDSLEYEYYPFATGEYKIVLCDSGVKHALADSAYNTRRQECEAGLHFFKQKYPGVQSLKDVSLEMFEAEEKQLSAPFNRRVRYVVEEMDRVKQGVLDLKSGNLPAFGKKMYATHQGLSKLFEVSCPELDFLVADAEGNPNVIGARMMGGGFGGCSINLVKADAAVDFAFAQAAAYYQAFGRDLKTYLIKLTAGTHVISDE